MMKATNLNQILNQKNEDGGVIDLSGKNLGLKRAKKLANWLKDYPNVHELNLADNGIGSEGVIALAEALKKHTTLHKLNLGNNKISMSAIKKVADVVKKQTNLQELYLNNNRIEDEAVTALAKALEEHSSLHTLDLSNNLIKANGVKDLFGSLTNHPNFCVLNLKNNSIGSDGAKALAEKIESHTKLKILNAESTGNLSQLQKLNLGNNQIDGEGAVALAKSIGKLSQLRVLDLEGNQIGNQRGEGGACLLANSLGDLTKLQKLNLCNNQIDDTAVKELANSLNNTGLKVLNLACNQISSDGVTALVQLLKNHCGSKFILKFVPAPALEILNLSDNQIDSSGAEALGEALKQYTKLRELDLGNNNIGDDGAEAMASLLTHYHSRWFPSLKMLELHNNQIGDTGANKLAEVLQNFKLENLNLSNNAINSLIIQKISDSFKGNKSNLILGNQSPQIEIFPVTYSNGLTEDEIKKIKECIQEGIKETVACREKVKHLVQETTDLGDKDKEAILKLITEDTILTAENYMDCLAEQILRCKGIGSINMVKNLIQNQNLINSLRKLDHEKSKLFFTQEDIEKIQSLINNNKLTLEELSKINNDVFKLHSVVEESSNLKLRESNKVAEATTKKTIFILGNTGAGKSTLANLLLKHDLEGIKYDKELRIDTVKPTDIQISHAGSSETKILNIMEVGDTVVVDCPGFRDSNSVQETANIYLINETCRTHNQIKFALVITFSEIKNTPDLVRLVKELTNMVEDIDKIKESVSLVVTQVPDDSKKEFINSIIDNVLKDNRGVSKNEKIIFEHFKEHFKDSVCLFLAPKKEGALEMTPLFTNIMHGDYCTDNITPLVNIAGKRDKVQQKLANKMINISSDKLNQIVHTIKEAIKHPLQCLDFKNSVFTKNYHLIEQSLRDRANHSEKCIDSSNNKNFLPNVDVTKIDLLSELKKELERKADSDEDFIKNLTNVIRQFQHFAAQEGQGNTVRQGEYIKTLDNYINALQQQFSCIEFFSGISNSQLRGWGKLQDIIIECIEVNAFNLKRLTTAIKIEPNRDEEYYEKALKYLILCKDEPECKINIAKAYIELGNIYLAKEDTGKAIDYYGEAIDIYPENPEIYQKLGQIFDKAGHYKQAIECYKIINHVPKVMDCFDKWITNEHDGAKASDLAIEKGDYCKSVGLYEKAKEAYHEVPCLTNNKIILKNTFDKIANIRKDQDQTRSNFHQMADEENFYHFDVVDKDFIDSIAETSINLLGHD